MEEKSGVRIDKWLWAARFFRTRSLAAVAVGSGHVQLNGTRVKPARLIKAGDRLRIRREDEVYEVEVLDLSERRVGALLVPTLWRESEESRQRRDMAREERRAAGGPPARPERRPDKRDRRKIVEFLKMQEEKMSPPRTGAALQASGGRGKD